MKKIAPRQPAKGEQSPPGPKTRTPLTNHSHPLNRAKPEGRAHPAERKVKHKHAPEDGD